jgi:hypothetical protein
MTSQERLLKAALVVFGVIFLLVYPVALVWPSGWLWHPGAPYQSQYFMMIVGIYATLGVFLLNAARNPQLDLVHGVVQRRPRRHHGGAIVRPRKSSGTSMGRCPGAASGRDCAWRAYGVVWNTAGNIGPGGVNDHLADHPNRFCGRASQVHSGARIVLLGVGGLDGHRDHSGEIAARQHKQSRIQADADTVEVPQHFGIGVGDAGHGSGVAVAADRQLSCRRGRHPAIRGGNRIAMRIASGISQPASVSVTAPYFS